MKKNYLFISLLALALASCNETNANLSNNLSSSSLLEQNSSSSQSINDTTTSSSTTSVVDTHDSSSSSSQQEFADQKPLLSYLSDGFAVQTIYSKSDLDSSTPALSYCEAAVGDGVVTAKQYLGIKNSFTDPEAYIYKQFQYQEGEDDGLIYQLSYQNLSGELKKELVMLEDPLTEEDYEFTFAESQLSNAFKKLQETDFIKQDEYFVLDVSEEKLEDIDYVNTINSISAQFYPLIDGVFTHYFLKQDLVSLKIKVDETNKPLSYEMDLGQSNSWGTIYAQKMEGTFIGLGNDVAVKLTVPKSKYAAFDEKIAALKQQNYEFLVRRSHTADPSGWGPAAGVDCLAYGISDGIDTFEVTNLLNNTRYGYKQNEDTSYQKYEINNNEKVATGEAIEGLLKNDLLPAFLLSSFFFEKIADTNEYRYVPTKLITNPMMTDHYLKFALDYGSYVVINHLTITINEDSIRFYNYHDASSDYYCDITFFNIGGVKEITANI